MLYVVYVKFRYCMCNPFGGNVNVLSWLVRRISKYNGKFHILFHAFIDYIYCSVVNAHEMMVSAGILERSYYMLKAKFDKSPYIYIFLYANNLTLLHL